MGRRPGELRAIEKSPSDGVGLNGPFGTQPRGKLGTMHAFAEAMRGDCRASSATPFAVIALAAVSDGSGAGASKASS